MANSEKINMGGMKNTPKWMKALEAQSWQAELLISGLLIAGLLQMPVVFIQWVEGYLIESSELGYLFLKFAAILGLMCIDSLIVFFGFHFLFRGIWVALLGLNSVFPEGINIDSTNSAGPKYWRKLKEKYPNLSAYNLELDQQSSLIFSLAIVTNIIIVSLSIIILLGYQLFRGLTSLFPIIADYVIHIGIGIYLIFLIVGLSTQFLAKKYPNLKVTEKLLNGNSFITETLFSLYIFKKPVGYITAIYISNVKSKLFIVILFVVSFFLGVVGGSQIGSNPIFKNFGVEKYITFNNAPHKTFSFNYDNLRQDNIPIFTPTISSDVIQGAILKVFIPTIEREVEQMGLTEFSFWKKIKTKKATRDSIYQADLAKYADFNRIFVNNVEYSNLDFRYYRHPHANERGVVVYILTNDFIKGKNVLEIRKNFFSKDEVQKVVRIPFYFE